MDICGYFYFSLTHSDDFVCRIFNAGDDAIEYVDTATKMVSYFVYHTETISQVRISYSTYYVSTSHTIIIFIGTLDDISTNSCKLERLGI